MCGDVGGSQLGKKVRRRSCSLPPLRRESSSTLSIEKIKIPLACIEKKLPPNCIDPIMRKEAMSTRELQALCFRHCNLLIHNRNSVHRLIPSRYRLQILFDIEAFSRNVEASALPISGKGLKRLGSRQGRESQRWAFDSLTQTRIRLVTGCVPILKDGRILTISASRKSKWILPKGGWGCDESMEESAVRESYEEAGITGFLGSKLCEVTFESRKAKKRRLSSAPKERLNEGEALLDMTSFGQPFDEASKLRKEHSSGEFSSTASDLSQLSDESSLGSPEQVVASSSQQGTRPFPSSQPFSFQLENGKSDGESVLDMRIPFLESMETPNCSLTIVSPFEPAFADTSASSAIDYTHVRMVLFPLYVSEVHDHWPESGRLRRAVSIDEAILMSSSRPEFLSALVEVKKKGLHLHPT